MIIKILGSGCKKCVALGENAKAAAQAAAIDAKIIDPKDNEEAKKLAASINALNLEKIKKGFDDATPVTFNQFG